jgi:tetratricopeptide (TPR) repeat protein
MKTVLLMVCTFATGFALQAAAQSGDKLVVSQKINPCIESLDARDPDIAIRTCEGLLAAGALSRDEKSVLYGSLGAAYFHRAVWKLGPGVTRENLAQRLTAECKQDLRVSIEQYSAALHAKPNSPMAAINFWNRGYNKELLGQTRETLSDYDQVVRLKPDYLKGYIYRARVLAQLGNRDRARVDLDHALSLAPYDPEVLNARKALRDTLRPP